MNERGSASIYAVSLMVVLLVVAQALAWLGGAVVAHRRAQAAADLAALAGATHPGDACAAAGVVAASNRAQVVGCRSDGRHVWVEVGVTARSLAGLRPTIRARAHAGPAP